MFGDPRWASDTELNGNIPDFIGNWSKLTTLRFQGNSFGSAIPSTFSNLTLLTDLALHLEFLKDMTSLGTLVLRNNNISGSIPSNIGDYQSLNHFVLPSGLRRLQRNFPCYRNSPVYMQLLTSMEYDANIYKVVDIVAC
ncbi:putative LRR receptor-like serine/threonine-protein kinase [Camellia lanceoleosa]|uniref:LRR receptor-like serine/threonine-protein kinase n=1 Tax=Camellia lanceoleosa TaxID=1840588 RepID=A0ACC0HTP6_9ERIC|nr:putative LRR receptor-like serine/threonine-protein kinase [Camellia lanceoleosa]